MPAAVATAGVAAAGVAAAGVAPTGVAPTGVAPATPAATGSEADGALGVTACPVGTRTPAGACGAAGEAAAVDAIDAAVDEVAAKLTGRSGWAGWGVGTGELTLEERKPLPRRSRMGEVAISTMEVRFDAGGSAGGAWDQFSRTCSRVGRVGGGEDGYL